ncbi:MAG TPA: hypothetical protein ENI33_09615, partial [Thermoplasmatales archaeon]|nr:hypothetical protein [Thermoplasmatales archaeon]
MSDKFINYWDMKEMRVKMKKVILAVVVGTFLFGAAMAGMNNYEVKNVSTENFLMRNYTFSEPEISEENGYAVISMQGTKSMMHEGKPILPYKVDVLRFPAGTKISVEAQEGNIMEKELSSKIKPYPMFTLATTKGKLVVKEGEIYKANEAYPENWVDYRATVGLYNGERVVTLSIFINPCRYIPSENKVLYTDQVKVKVKYDLPSSLPFVNDEYDLLIICPDKWIDALQELKQHKESHGIRTVIAGLNEIYTGKYFSAYGRDNAEKIKYFIKDAIEQWGIKYVMLVGGRQGGVMKERWLTPVRYTNLDDMSGWEKGYLSDLYFADVYKYEDGEPV